MHLRSAAGWLRAGLLDLGWFLTHFWDLVGRNEQALPHLVFHPQWLTGACSHENGEGPRKQAET